MVVDEDPRFTRDYLDPSKRFDRERCAGCLRGRHRDSLVEVEYPLGHRAAAPKPSRSCATS